jgi:hypothetical protein
MSEEEKTQRAYNRWKTIILSSDFKKALADDGDKLYFYTYRSLNKKRWRQSITDLDYYNSLWTCAKKVVEIYHGKSIWLTPEQVAFCKKQFVDTV